MNLTLFEISADMQALAALLEEVGGDVSEADAEAAVDAWLKENADALQEKLDGYAALIRAFEARGAFRRDEAERVDRLADADERNARRMKDRLRWFFETHGLERVETARHRLSLTSNGGLRPLEVFVPAAELPGPYRRVVYSPDADAIRKALENGASLPFAALGERGKHIRIR